MHGDHLQQLLALAANARCVLGLRHSVRMHGGQGPLPRRERRRYTRVRRVIAQDAELIAALADAVERLGGELQFNRSATLESPVDLLLLLRALVLCGEHLKHRYVPDDRPWHQNIAAFVLKMFGHGASFFHLCCGTRLPEEIGVAVGFLDFPSLAVILRAAFETHLAFYYLYIDAPDQQVSELRDLVWRLSACKYRKKFGFYTSEGLEHQIERDVEEVTLREQVRQHHLFSALTPTEQKSAAVEADWRFELPPHIRSYPHLAVKAGCDFEWADGIYSWLSSYTHAGEHAMAQIGFVSNKESEEIRLAQADLADTLASECAVFLAHFIKGFLRLFPGRKLDPVTMERVRFYGYLGTEAWKRASTAHS